MHQISEVHDGNAIECFAGDIPAAAYIGDFIPHDRPQPPDSQIVQTPVARLQATLSAAPQTTTPLSLWHLVSSQPSASGPAVRPAADAAGHSSETASAVARRISFGQSINAGHASISDAQAQPGHIVPRTPDGRQGDNKTLSKLQVEGPVTETEQANMGSKQKAGLLVPEVMPEHASAAGTFTSQSQDSERASKRAKLGLRQLDEPAATSNLARELEFTKAVRNQRNARQHSNSAAAGLLHGHESSLLTEGFSRLDVVTLQTQVQQLQYELKVGLIDLCFALAPNANCSACDKLAFFWHICVSDEAFQD